MLNLRSFAALCIVTAAVTLAAVLVSEDSGAIPGSGRPLFPDLISQLNEIRIIEIKRGEAKVVAERNGAGWTLPDKSGYPADGDKIHKLLLGAAGLSRVEPKTSNPALYSELGLATAGGDDSGPITYALKSGAGETVAALMVGNSAPATGDPDLSEFYVRTPDESQIWLVEGKLPGGSAAIDWLKRKIIDIDRQRVREARVEHAGGEVVTIVRGANRDQEFGLKEAPPSQTVDGQWKLNDIGRLFSSLELEDVRPKENAPVSGNADYVVNVSTVDGLKVRMDVFKVDDKAFAVLEAALSEEKTDARTSAGGALESSQNLKTADDIRAEAAALNDSWQRWAYVIPGYKLDALARTRAELLKELKEKDGSDQG